MKGMERITTVRLAEALSQSGLVPNEKITDALYQQDRSGHPFIEILVDTGEVSEWELARVVVQHFQLPFLMASSVIVNKKAVAVLPENLLFEHRLLPLDIVGKVLNISMPVLLTYKTLTLVQNLSGMNVFPFVGLASENTKFLYQLFPNHPPEETDRRPYQAESDSGDTAAWENIFDLGDQEVLKDLGM